MDHIIRLNIYKGTTTLLRKISTHANIKVLIKTKDSVGSFPALYMKTEAPLRIKFNLFQCRYISPTTYTGKSSDTHHQLFLLWKSFRYTSPSIFYVKILPTHIIYTSIWLKKTDIWVNRYYRKLYRQYLDSMLRSSDLLHEKLLFFWPSEWNISLFLIVCMNITLY